MSVSGPFGSGAFGTGIFSSSPFYSTADLVTAVLRATGHSNPTTETAKRALVLNFVNNRYALVSTMKYWSWLYSSVDFNLEAPYDTGTVALTQGSTTVTGVATSWDSNLIPYHKFFVNSGKPEVYTVDSVDSLTGITLASEYASESISGASYMITKPIYALPADVENVQSILVDGVGEVQLIGTQELRRLQASQPTLVGPPRYATVTSRRAQDGVRTIEFFPAPDEAYQCHLDYGVNLMKLEDSADSYPLIPDRHRQVLYYGALSDMDMYMKQYPKAQMSEQLYSRSLLGMQNDTQLTDSRVRMRPVTQYNTISRRGRRYKVFMNAIDFSRED